MTKDIQKKFRLTEAEQTRLKLCAELTGSTETQVFNDAILMYLDSLQHPAKYPEHQQIMYELWGIGKELRRR